jgi:transcriptional regulator
MTRDHLDENRARPYSRAHDRRRDHSDRSPPPLHPSGTGGDLRLRFQPCRRIRSAALFFSTVRFGLGGSYVTQEFEMYTPPMFKPDRAASLGFAEARGFGTVCAWDGARPIASSLPFYLTYADDGTPHAAFHVARGNALAGFADGKSSWLLAVNGADAYISPDWYASPDQVPTWLYQAVHLTGTVRRLSDSELAVHLDALSAKFESWLAPKLPWTSSKMTAGRFDAMKKAIVGLEMTVEEIEGSFKLNQHKSDVDHVAISDALAQQADPAAKAIGQQLVALRPQLNYKQPLSVSGLADSRNAL